MRVPFSDLTVSEEEKQAVRAVLDSGWPSKGKVSQRFEDALADYLHSNIALVNSGSAALMVALLANGVKAGDTVLVPDFTFVATASVPAILGCKIVPVDADPETFNVGDDFAKAYDRTKPTVPWSIVTDVAGLPVPQDDYAVWIIEDAAEALGAEADGRKVGSTKNLTIFSFQATKQLSTVEGGAIASKDAELIEKCRRISDYGRTKERYVHSEIGMNFRTTDIASAIGLVQLSRLEESLKRRNEIAARYRKEIAGLTFQRVPDYVTRHAYWTMIGLTKDLTEWVALVKKFEAAGVDARQAWRPIHLQDPFDQDYPLNFNLNAVNIFSRAVMLPIFNSMSDAQVDEVIRVANS